MKKKLFTLAMAMIMTVAMSVPVMAGDTEYDGSTTSETSQQTHVTATLTSSYKVSLPALLNLVEDTTSETIENNQYRADYTVKAYGNISDSKYVSIIPDAGFELALTGSDITVPATVTQEVQKWSRTGDLSNGYQIMGQTTDGNVVAVLTEDGAYAGDFNFTYSLQAK